MKNDSWINAELWHPYHSTPKNHANQKTNIKAPYLRQEKSW